MIPVVVGIIQNNSGELLIAKRPAHTTFAGLWEFPGGKIEAGESPYQALIREFNEELAIQIKSADHFCNVVHDYGDRIVNLDVWWITAFTGTPLGAEGQELRWVSAATLSNYQFPMANDQIVARVVEKCLG